MSATDTRSADVREKASEVVRDFTSQANNLKESATDAFSQSASRIKDSASDLAQNATSKVENVLANQKVIGADYIASFAQAAERAAKEFDGELPQAARLIRQASQTVNGVADKIRDSEVRDLVGELSDYARRRPTLVFGGAMVLGFAALRFLKSTAPERSSASPATNENFGNRYQS